MPGWTAIREYSPSGTGVRILFKASLPYYDKERYYINNCSIGLEIYVAGYTSRFVTVTGNDVSGTGIEDRTKALIRILEKYMVRPGKPVSHATAPGSYFSDDSVLTKISTSKQAGKFNALWNGSIPDGKSHSEADAALCAMLVFWCSGDTDQMDRLFRQSALMRDKWNRDDYREATLSKAVAMCAEFYRPVGKSSAFDDFNDLQQKVAALFPAENDRYPWNDIGNSMVLNAAQVKNMTGNDTINARFLHENSFDLEPQFKIYVNTNYLPAITDITMFTSERVLIIPFDKHFEAWEQDKTLKDAFRKPEV